MSNRTRIKKQLWIKTEPLARFSFIEGLVLIPLHRYDDVSIGPNGGERQDGKRPLDAGWQKKQYDPDEVIDECERKNRNVGVRIGPGWIGVDIDPRNGGSLEALQAATPDFDWSKASRARTGGGGFHLYTRDPVVGARLMETLEALPGIEFKRVNRQFVAPGSIHPGTLEFYLWDNAIELCDAPDFPQSLLDQLRIPERSQAHGGGEITDEELAEKLKHLDVANFRDETKWRNLMFACHHATAGDGREEFIQWSTDDPMYANDEWRIGRRWDSLHTDKPGAITVGTLNHFLREAGAVNAQVPNEVGDDFDGEADVPKNEIAPIETRGLRLNSKGIAPDTYTNALAAIDKARLAPAWNELAQVVECRAKELPWPKHYGHVLNDHVARLVRALLAQQFQGIGYESGKDNVFEAIFTIAYQNKFNPILDYLDSLKWDGVARVENLFGTYFNCGSGKYIRAVSKCFMVGAVARQRRPGCKFDTMPVLQGKQGEGKSDGMKRLAGPEWFDDSDLGNLHDKDAAMKLRGIWLKEFAEIDSLTRAGANALKAFLSSATDRQRDPYGRIVETYPRRCVFFGTVNESGYLRDPTGGRRYWPLEVLAPIDLDRISADRDQLWAEANMMQARGDSHVLPETLWPEAGKRQAEQTTNDPWADKLRDYLEQREEDWADYQLGEAADLEPLPPTGYTVRSYSRRLASRRNSNPRTGRKGSGRRWRPR